MDLGGEGDFGGFFDYPSSEGHEHHEGLVFLGDCSDEDWQVIRDHSETRRCPAGDTVIAPGEGDRALYIVAEGTLDVLLRRGRRGRSHRVASLGPGSVFGELSFFDGRPRSALVRAMTDVHLLRLSFGAFEVLSAKDPVLARSILLDLGRILAARLRKTEAFMEAGNVTA